MEKVAEHINEMQRIHEEYGAIFDHLFRQHQKSCKQPIDLSPGKVLKINTKFPLHSHSNQFKMINSMFKLHET